MIFKLNCNSDFAVMKFLYNFAKLKRYFRILHSIIIIIIIIIIIHEFHRDASLVYDVVVNKSHVRVSHLLMSFLLL